MKEKRLKPEVGRIYEHRSGGRWLCREVWKTQAGEPGWSARLVNVKTGWSVAAHGLTERSDGRIEWDYSAGGYFELVQ